MNNDTQENVVRAQEDIKDSIDEQSNIPVLVNTIPELNERYYPANEVAINIENQLTQDQSDEDESQEIDTQIDLTNDTKIIPDPQLILNQSWEKVEMLLMNNLPPQLSGTFIQLLNTCAEENKQQVLDELSLLDEQSLIDLMISLERE